VAKELGVKWDLVQAWVQRGWLSVTCIDGRWRITAEALEAALSDVRVMLSRARSVKARASKRGAGQERLKEVARAPRAQR